MNRLRELRKRRKMTQEALGKLIGVQKAAICKYETGLSQLPQHIILKLCDCLNVSADYLLCRNEDAQPPVKLSAPMSSRGTRHTALLPVVGRVHAGLPMLAEENIAEYVGATFSDANQDEYFFMDVEGDCMIGDNIPHGARVLVHMQPNVENSQIAVVRLGDEVLLRRIKRMNDHLILISSNPKYEPLIVNGGDVQIIGRVTEIRINLK